jgi:hypothetical protein
LLSIKGWAEQTERYWLLHGEFPPPDSLPRLLQLQSMEAADRLAQNHYQTIKRSTSLYFICYQPDCDRG